MDSDVELMLAFQNGDEEAFRELVSRHEQRLYNFFFRLTWDVQMAEDFTQEVFCRVFTSREQYRARAKFTTYLYRIAKNIWIDHYRVHGKRPSGVSLDAGRGRADSTTMMRDAIPDRATTPAESMRRREVLEQIGAAVAQLPEGQRLVFTLSEYSGMSYEEIAETLEIPVGTVKSRMHAAVAKLRGSITRRLKNPFAR